MTEFQIKRDINVGSARSMGLPPVDFRAMHEIVLPYRLRRGVSDKIAWDVAHASLFLASDDAKYVSGVLLPVDGALTCRTG